MTLRARAPVLQATKSCVRSAAVHTMTDGGLGVLHCTYVDTDAYREARRPFSAELPPQGYRPVRGEQALSSASATSCHSYPPQEEMSPGRGCLNSDFCQQGSAGW